MESLLTPLALLVGLAVGATAEILRRRLAASRRVQEAEDEAKGIRAAADRDAAARVKELEAEAQDRLARNDREQQEEAKRRRRENDEIRRDLESRQRNAQRRNELLEAKQTELDRRAAEIEARGRECEAAAREAESSRAQQQARLEQIARLTAEQARAELVNQVRADARREAATYLRKVQEETRESADAEATRLVVQSLQRFSSAQVIDATITVVNLPNEEMKGRIIGREGRNIRALETATGIDLLVDDTPQAILLSSFDPVRREVARLAVEHLVEDGRIHPARIEEVVEKARKDFDERLTHDGEAAAFEVGIADIHPRLIRLLGRMRYVHGGGQNLLQHARETVLLATNMASQLKVDPDVVRRAAFLHEVGNVDDSSAELHPTLRSADLAHKFNESDGVVRAIRSLHPEEQDRSLEGMLVQIAHAISAARPGARNENLEVFTRRLSDLERIAGSFPGVTGVFAIKAGKDLRVLVNSEKVSDADAIWLARDIADRIQEQVGYPGQIRVSVIRETRSVDYAM
jgi:ribonuclease Y